MISFIKGGIRKFNDKTKLSHFFTRWHQLLSMQIVLKFMASCCFPVPLTVLCYWITLRKILFKLSGKNFLGNLWTFTMQIKSCKVIL